MVTPEQWTAAARGAIAAIDPEGASRATVFGPTRRTDVEDDVGEPVQRAFVAHARVGMIVLGLTGWTERLLGATIADAATAALAAIAAALGLRITETAEITIDERVTAIAPSPDRGVSTIGIDRKLSQLMATTVAVIDVVELRVDPVTGRRSP